MKAYELLDSEEKWCKGANARDKDGNIVDPTSSTAKQWCINGALCRCYRKVADMGAAANKLSKLLTGRISWPGGPYISWQDKKGRTFEEVHQLLKEADV